MIGRRICMLFLISSIVTGLSLAHADEHPFCDEWGIFGLGTVYLTSDRLIITENEIKWPGCPSVPYKIVSAKDEAWMLHVPQTNCNRMRKDSGEGYLVSLIPGRDTNDLKIKLYDFKEGIKKDKELAWGEFYRIPFDKERNFFGHVGKYAITMQLNGASGVRLDYCYLSRWTFQEINSLNPQLIPS